MKKGWETMKLGEVCSFLNRGVAPEYVEKGGIVVLNQRCVRDHRVNFQLARRHDTKTKSVNPERLVQAGDVLINSTGEGTLGRVAQLREPPPKPTTVDSHVTIVRPAPGLFFTEFFGYALRDIEEELQASGEGCGGQTELNRSVLAEKFVVRFPKALSEQKRIVRVLDEAFAAIATAQANTEKNLQNAGALFESHLHSIFTNKKWQKNALGDLCTGVEYGSSAKSKKEGNVPVLRMGNIQGGRFDWEHLVYTDDKEEIARYMLRHNDVLFNRTNSPELVGKTAIYKNERPAIFAGYLIRIHRKPNLLDADYLNYFLNSRIAFDYGKTVVISSVNQANINGAKLKTYPIPTPSLSEQNAIVTQLDALAAETQRLTRLYEQKRAALADLKKALLHQAFSGEL